MRSRFSSVMAGIGIFRLAVIVLVVWVVLAGQAQVSSASLILAGFIVLYAVVLGSLALVAWSRRAQQLVEGLTMACDGVAAFFVLVNFSTHVTTAAPALLPVLAYEGWALWNVAGAVFGIVAEWGILLAAWWLQVWSHRVPFSGETVVFWLGVMTVLSLLPVFVGSRQRGQDIWMAAAEPQPAAALPVSFQTSSPVILTEREEEVLQALKKGKSIREIAQELVVEPGTVKSHLHHLYGKCQVANRYQLLHWAQEREKAAEPGVE